MANYNLWNNLDRAKYKIKKNEVLNDSYELIQNLIPSMQEKMKFNDVFTPTTIKRYTRHHQGCVYGSPNKRKDGKTPIKGLYLCGTDQGFLGIVGSMLSGISMANLHVLMGDS